MQLRTRRQCLTSVCSGNLHHLLPTPEGARKPWPGHKDSNRSSPCQEQDSREANSSLTLADSPWRPASAQDAGLGSTLVLETSSGLHTAPFPRLRRQVSVAPQWISGSRNNDKPGLLFQRKGNGPKRWFSRLAL